MVAVIALGGEEERAEFGPVEPPPFVRVDLGSPDVLSRVGGDPSVDVGKPVEPADRRQSPVDGRGRQTSLLHVSPPQLDMGSGGFEHGQTHVSAPLEEHPHVVAVGLEGTPAVAGEVGGRRHLGIIEEILLGRGL